MIPSVEALIMLHHMKKATLSVSHIKQNVLFSIVQIFTVNIECNQMTNTDTLLTDIL